MRKEMTEELNKVNRKFYELKLELLNNPKTSDDNIRKLYSIRAKLEKHIFAKYADDLQKLNAGQKLRINNV